MIIHLIHGYLEGRGQPLLILLYREVLLFDRLLFGGVPVKRFGGV